MLIVSGFPILYYHLIRYICIYIPEPKNPQIICAIGKLIFSHKSTCALWRWQSVQVSWLFFLIVCWFGLMGFCFWFGFLLFIFEMLVVCVFLRRECREAYQALKAVNCFSQDLLGNDRQIGCFKRSESLWVKSLFRLIQYEF